MATRTAAKKISKTPRVMDEPVQETTFITPPPTPVNETSTASTKSKALMTVAIILAGLSLWWWQTNSWPVVGFVGMKPIFRHQIDQTLYSQYGEKTVSGLVTQYQIEQALDKKGITVTEKDIDDKIAEIKTRLPAGTDFDTELKNQGLTMKSLRDLMRIQLRLNKIAEGSASASADEIAKYIKENDKMMMATTAAEKQKEAEETIKQQKTNDVITKFVEESQKSVNVWWWPSYRQVTPTPMPTSSK